MMNHQLENTFTGRILNGLILRIDPPSKSAEIQFKDQIFLLTKRVKNVYFSVG